MSLLTNKQNLPQQIVSAIMRDPYTRGDSDISVTQLISPARIVQLKKRYDDRIQEDASDRIWSLLGQVCHSILERADDTGAFHEERIWVEIDGWKVSGASDCYITKQRDFLTGEYQDIIPTIRDYKFTKVVAAKYPKKEWEEQLNLLAFLWESHGFPVERLDIVAVYRDWSKVMQKITPDYPPAAQVFKQKLWSMEKRELFIQQRVAYHQAAEGIEDRFLPLCTPEEQWRKTPKWAVIKPGVKKAMRLLNSYAQADAWISGNPKAKKAEIVHRPGAATRCEMFCDVAPFCDQYAAEKRECQPCDEEEAA